MLPFISPNNLTNLWPVSQLTGTVTLNQGGGVPETIVVSGVTYYVLRDDASNEVLRDDGTNEPLYDKAA